MEISGRLSAFSPAELLQWAHNERRTGALVIRRSRLQKRIYLQKGEVVGCLSDDPADYYGQHLLLHGFLEEPALVEALSHCTRHGKRLGLTLTELGLLTVDQVRETLRQQIKDCVCGLFLWQRGVFYFERETPPEEVILPRPIHTMGLVMEGTRWVDETARFRELFPHDNVVLRRGPAWASAVSEAAGQELSPVERRIVDHVDGLRTFAQVHAAIRGSYFRVLEGAYHLCLKEVLDLGEIGETIESTSLELSVYDLLLEQAVEEQNQDQGKEVLLPLALLGNFHPVWLRRPPEAELANLPETLLKLSASFDGSRPLEELLAFQTEVDGEVTGELEYFQEQLTRGTLALLPGAPDALAEELESSNAPARSWWQRLFRRE